ETDLCNGIDDDCDGDIDEDDPPQNYYADRDGDGHGDPASLVHVCGNERPAGYITVGDDCDDRNAAVFPGAPALRDRIYNDCGTGVGGQPRPSEDVDGDGFAPTMQASLCESGPAYPATDCNDTDATVYPGAAEICDRQWNDCSDPLGGEPRLIEDNDN